MVKIESRKPEDEFGGYLKLGAGNLDTTDVEAVIGGPIGDKWAVRLSVLHQTREDFVANDASAIDPPLSALDDPNFLETPGYLKAGGRTKRMPSPAGPPPVVRDYDLVRPFGHGTFGQVYTGFA